MNSRMSSALPVFSVCMLLFIAVSIDASEYFRYKYVTGDQYIIKSEVRQNIKTNGQFSHSSEFENWITIRVTRGSTRQGSLEVSYRIIETAKHADDISTIRSEYNTAFTKDIFGIDTVSPDAYQPMVQSVPRFPEQAIEIGDGWVYPAQEVHDLRDLFGVESPYRFDILVHYRYLGQRTSTRDGLEYPAFEISYPIEHARRVESDGRSISVRIRGQSESVLLWDNENGRPHSYSEQFEFEWRGGGRVLKFSGDADAYIIPQFPNEREDIADELEKKLDTEAIRDVDVHVTDEGVALTLGNVQFNPDSAVLLAGERERLQKISTIIKEYPRYRVIVIGHTALAGSAAGRERLSLKRAQKVGQFLQTLGIMDVVTQGVGARDPIADNNTEEGRQKNRRVELRLIDQ